MKVLKNEPMARHTSFMAGGPAAAYVVAESLAELQTLLRFLHREQLPYKLIGRGTNLLVSDEGLPEVVVEVAEQLSGLACEDGLVVAEGGAKLRKAAFFAAERGLSGMEALSGIPGTVGGALVMNAGAYGTEIKDVLAWAEVLSPSGELLRLEPEALKLGYRSSVIPGEGYTAVRAAFRLQPRDRAEIERDMQEFDCRRKDKQPLDKPSAGSTFKRPSGYFAGALIQEAGLRGYRFGGASVSEKHCGFIVNDRGASAAEIYTLIRLVQARVKAQSGVTLETEVRLWGEFKSLQA